MFSEKNCPYVFYETRKRELNRKLIYECRCDERLKVKDEGSTYLVYTGFREGLEHLKIRDKFNKQEVCEYDA
jgi:hypothetical protein